MANNFSQSPVQYNSAALAAPGVINTFDVTFFDAASIIVAGATSSTTLIEVSNDNAVSWSAISFVDKASATPNTHIAAATGITGPGVYQVSLPFGLFRLRCSAYVSGSPLFNVYLCPSDIQP